MSSFPPNYIEVCVFYVKTDSEKEQNIGYILNEVRDSLKSMEEKGELPPIKVKGVPISGRKIKGGNLYKLVLRDIEKLSNSDLKKIITIIEVTDEEIKNIIRNRYIKHDSIVDLTGTNGLHYPGKQEDYENILIRTHGRKLIPVICINKSHGISSGIVSVNKDGSVEVSIGNLPGSVTVFLLEDTYITNSKHIKDLIRDFIIKYFHNNNENYPEKLQCS